MFELITNARRCDIGIDLGTANCVVYKENHGIILREPSVVAFDQQTQAVLATATPPHTKPTPNPLKEKVPAPHRTAPSRPPEALLDRYPC